MKAVHSLSELRQALQANRKSYLLIYKSGNQQSDCAFSHLTEAVSLMPGAPVFYADVNQTRDIHPFYEITSAPALLEFEHEQFKNQVKGCHAVSHYKAMFEGVIFRSENLKNEKTQKRVTVYSTPTCSWCNTLKSYLRKHQVPFTDIDVSKDQRAADELVKRSGQMGVPQTDINGQMVVGFDQKRLNQLLELSN
jgi:glutaredoxin-like YruB-family protein